MNAPPDETSRRWSPMVIGSVAVGLLLLLLLIPTFRTPPVQKNDPASGAPQAEGATETQCDRTLMSAMDGLEPSRLGISSETRVMVGTLNNWLTQCADPDGAIVDESDPQLREQLMSADGFRDSQASRFQSRDAEHIRNSLLAAAIVNRVTAEATTDEERALALFYYVVRTLDLVPDDAPELLLTPYESLVLGLGTAADRGWTYALLMRQMRLDVVMIQPRGRAETTYWLLGAVIPGEGVLLLDPRLGLPIIPAADFEAPQSALPQSAATLAEVRQNEQLLRQFDQGERLYPLTGEDLTTVDVYAIGTSSTFAPRVGQLQLALPEPVEVFDGLGPNEWRETGLIERLVQAGEGGLWTREQVQVWAYPQQHWSSTSERTEEQQQRLAMMQAVLSGPSSIAISVNVNEQDQLQLGTTIEKPQRSLLEARLAQLLGNFAEAQQSYLQTRLNHVNLAELQSYMTSVQQTLAGQIQNPKEAQQTYQAIQQQVMQEVNRQMQNVPEMQLNILAADMATYWAAQAQYEQLDYRLAAESALAYIARGAGNHFMAAIYLASLSLVQDGRPAEALELAGKQPPGANPSHGYVALVDRWRKMSGSAQSGDPPAATTPDSARQPKDSKTQPGAEPPADPGQETPAKPEADTPATPEAAAAAGPDADDRSAPSAPQKDPAGDDSAAVEEPGAPEEPGASPSPAPSADPDAGPAEGEPES